MTKKMIHFHRHLFLHTINKLTSFRSAIFPVSYKRSIYIIKKKAPLKKKESERNISVIFIERHKYILS